MTVEDLLRRYPRYKAALKQKEIEVKAIREEIIEGTAAGSDERVQTSGPSDTTSAKAMKLVGATERLEREMAVYKLKVELIENALTVLSDKERDVVERLLFKGHSYSKIDYEERIPSRTCRSIKRGAMAKLEPFLTALL